MIACDSAIWNGNAYDSSEYMDTYKQQPMRQLLSMDLTINYSTDSSIAQLVVILRMEWQRLFTSEPIMTPCKPQEVMIVW